MMKSWCEAGATLRDVGRVERPERSAGQGGGVGQAYDGWQVVFQFGFQQWVEAV